MDIKTYLSERGSTAALARKLGVSDAYLWQLVNGNRSISPERATQIELATAREVRRWDLRPADWHLIWPELIGAEGAPTIQAAA
jgi:DNA-binding transcriptional regulator YdaS (Cro superfamily)